jgi:hypothetical protein
VNNKRKDKSKISKKFLQSLRKTTKIKLKTNQQKLKIMKKIIMLTAVTVLTIVALSFFTSLYGQYGGGPGGGSSSATTIVIGGEVGGGGTTCPPAGVNRGRCHLPARAGLYGPCNYGCKYTGKYTNHCAC